MNTFNLTLDLSKRGMIQTVQIRQGDTNGTTIVATITDHGVAASTTGLTARFQMRLPDGTHYYRKAASLSGNTATVTLDEAQAASAVGRTDTAYFQLLQGSTVVASTESFSIVVLPDALADAEVAESYDSAIQDAIDALDAAVEQMPDMVEDVLADHPEWTTTVQDGSITKAKLATDLARDRERLLYRLDNLLTNALPEGDVATASDAAQTPVAGLALYGRSTQDGTPTPSAPVPIESVAPDSQGNISLWARGRNLVRSYVTNSYTYNGITWEYVSEGMIKASGSTGSGSSSGQWKTFDLGVLPAGTYTVTMTPVSGTISGTGLAVSYRTGADASATGDVLGVSSGGKVTATLTTDGVRHYWLQPYVRENSTASNLVLAMQVQVGAATPFQPYAATVTPIDLDGHELRSLPDGTRDELTVDEYGHAVLVQRVGETMFDGSSDEQWSSTNNSESWAIIAANIGAVAQSGLNLRCDRLSPNMLNLTNMPVWTTKITDALYCKTDGITTMANWRTWLASNPLTLDYKLATPVTHDLGYVDAVPLVGPDLTAQAIPTAPFALTYERDLNTTLARLESAIATLA